MKKTPKVTLRELDLEFRHPINPDKNVATQINPDTLKIVSWNQCLPSTELNGKKRARAVSRTITATTKLSVQLLFDLTAKAQEVPEGTVDVRNLTKKIAYFATPLSEQGHLGLARPTRFNWGSFYFDGYVEYMEQTLDLFRSDGNPQRATVLICLRKEEPLPPSTAAEVVTTAEVGSTLAAMGAALMGGNWQAVAQGNGFASPRKTK